MDATTTDLKALLNNCNVPQVTKITDRRPGIPYRINRFSKAQICYGEAVYATVEELVGDDIFLNVYLPSRFLKILDDAIIQSYNKGEGKGYAFSAGKGIEFV